MSAKAARPEAPWGIGSILPLARTGRTWEHSAGRRKPHLVDVASEQCPQNGGGLHDHDQIPVNERLVAVRVPPIRVEHEVCQRTAHDRHITQRNRIVGLKAWTGRNIHLGCCLGFVGPWGGRNDGVPARAIGKTVYCW